MYSVEDLLISHGYKLPKHATSSSTPTPAPASSSPPPSYNKHNEILENRPTSRTVNGYERGSGASYRNSGNSRQPQPFNSGCTNNNNEARDRSQPRREGEGRSHVDTHSLGESLTSDSGYCDGTRGPQAQTKDLSYWRRRGQDFTVLLDYADHGGHRGYIRSEGPQQARGQEMSAEEHQRAAQERQCWAAQVQAQAQVQVQTQAKAQARSREREAALHQWKMASERKCQSLGTDEWHPAVNFGRQLSQSEGEWWAPEQQRIHARTPEGMIVHPRTKAKSQSLPRMLQPESLQYGQELYRRVNGHPLSHYDLYRAPRWPENGRPASANQLSMTPKPRFSRPPRPPSYELHQQIRGSYEMLSATLPQARDRTPLPISRTSDPQLDYFSQDSGPPGYIPPPSYKRAPIMAVGRQGYGEIAVDYRYRGDVYQQMQLAPGESHWFTRHPAASLPDPQRDRSLSSQKQLYPVYNTKEHIGGGLQYISFDDPRIRHISSALGGNSLTDADKIRHIRNELPSVTVSEPASDDSAFLPPPLGPFIAAKLAVDANQMSRSNLDNDNNRWHRDLHKETVDNFPATDQNYNNRYPKNQRPPSSPSSTFHSPLTRSCSRQGPNSDQVFAETITQVKKIAPGSGPENNRNTKRRVSETIFCLVSVPVHTPINISKDLSADQNNNETMPSLTVTNTETFAVGLKEAQSIRSKSVNEMPIKPHYSHCHTSSISSMRNYKRAPLMKEIIDAWALQASEDKELCYVGSWPENQYRNQETQTGSPLTLVKSPEPQSPPGVPEPIQSGSDTTTDIGVGTENTSSCGYSLTGQKSLHLSSNSAFSRLSLSPIQPPSMQLPQQPLQQNPSTSPSKAQEHTNQQPSSPRKSNSCPPECAEQVTFGQFLLKPVNRRPCDVIGELESINKKMEDTISKRPHMGQSADYMDGMNNRTDQFKSEAHFMAGPEPSREALILPPMHTEKPTSIKVRSKSFTSTSDLDSMDVRGTFSRPQANNMSPTNEQTVLPSAGLIDNCLLSPLSVQNEQLYRQDIPVPEESMLRDVGLTVYTETPGGPGEPVQRSLSVPSPLSHKETHQSVQQESVIALIKNSGSAERKSDKELQAEVDPERQNKLDNVPSVRGEANSNRASSESRLSPRREGSPHITRLIREASFLLEDDDNETYAITEALTCKELTIADKHLENLLFKEKANTLPTEDLSNLYEVKYAKGIPENESIEQRAARILGIAVPVEALGVADNQDETNTTVGEKQLDPKEETKQVIGEWAYVREETTIVHQEEIEEVQGTGLGIDYEEGDRNKLSTNHSSYEHECLDLPEFPPTKLSLSLPVSPDEKLALSMCSGEKKARGGACKLIESLQDKLNSSASSSATSLSRSTVDRMARLKELDSVSRIRRLSLKGSESGGEADYIEKDGDGEKEEVEKQEVEAKKLEVEGTEEVYVHERQDEFGETKDVCKPKEVNKVICKKEKRQEDVVGEINVEIALKVDNDGVELKVEEPEGEVELRIVEEGIEKPLEKLRDGQNAEASSRDQTLLDTEKIIVPKPKQRTRLQKKPPLLPKPRSVPKREITASQHPSIGSGICEPSNVEDEEIIFVSDTYDPSRVERV